jgi:pimeloyl-ACP methyl ester carboxylesterase
MMIKLLLLSVAVLLACSVQNSGAEEQLGEDGFADSSGVKIHYVTAGKGPLVVMIHGFPDYWYTWRAQMPELAKHFQVVAVDMRGYNKSDQPDGVENYALPKLVGDIDAVVKHFKADKAIIVGHDWGGIVAWTYAMSFPDKTDKLVILNLPHPKGLARELANNKQQQKNSQYARDFQQPDAVDQLLKKAKQASALTGGAKGDDKEIIAQALTFWVRDPDAKKKYIEAFKRSNYEGMLNYYKANYPREPYTYSEDSAQFPPVKCPVLMFHGLKDTALLPGALNDTWNWLEKDLTLVTIPGASHFVQQDAAEKVTKCMVAWLTMQ